MYRITIAHQPTYCPVTVKMKAPQLLDFLHNYYDNISQESPDLSYKIIDIHRIPETEELDFQDPKPAEGLEIQPTEAHEGSEARYTDCDDRNTKLSRLSNLIHQLKQLNDSCCTFNPENNDIFSFSIQINLFKVLQDVFIAAVCLFIGGLVASSSPLMVVGVVIAVISAIAFAFVKDTSPSVSCGPV